MIFLTLTLLTVASRVASTLTITVVFIDAISAVPVMLAWS